MPRTVPGRWVVIPILIVIVVVVGIAAYVLFFKNYPAAHQGP